jgi:tetratricopeptide (TPR) repeat protein
VTRRTTTVPARSAKATRAAAARPKRAAAPGDTATIDTASGNAASGDTTTIDVAFGGVASADAAPTVVIDLPEPVQRTGIEAGPGTAATEAEPGQAGQPDRAPAADAAADTVADAAADAAATSTDLTAVSSGQHPAAPAAASAPKRRIRAPWRLATCLVLALVVGLAVGRFAFNGPAAPSSDEDQAARAGTTAGSAATIERLQAQLRELPDEPRVLTRLGLAHLARARETADPTQYARAEQALTRADKLAPGQADTLTGLGVLALARHDFRAALQLAGRARKAAPDAGDALAVLADAQVELGRYHEATRTVQALVDRKPTLASLSRVSYLRELHGDHDGAVTAMEQAATAGSAAPAERAYIRTLLGDLHLSVGDLRAAEAEYARALYDASGTDRAEPEAAAGLPTPAAGPAGSYDPAEVGLARVAAARGDLAGAAERLRTVTARRPEAGSVALLGDIEAALGNHAEAARQYELVRTIEALSRANGVTVDLELARFEADHAKDPDGDPELAVKLARAAAKARPTIYAADALGWALRQAGQPEEALKHARAATRLGTLDAQLWYHLAMIEADLGRNADARRHLGMALNLNPYLTVKDLPVANRLAEILGTHNR